MKQIQYHGLSLKERLYIRLKREGNCWVWTGAKMKNRGGYGAIRIGNKTVPTHRLSWEIHYGPIPEGKYVLHHCDNPPCVRPEHLFLGTQQDNIRDAIAKHRFFHDNYAQGEKIGSAKLTESQVLEIRASNERSSLKLARIYGVHKSTIKRIRNRTLWKHI